MLIKSLRVRNFRCIKEATLECDNLTAIIGRNGSGKSTFLRALELFYTPNAKYSQEDFYNGETSEPITITITFNKLSNLERELFAPYIDGDTLTVEKELTWPIGKSSQKYFGSTLQNPDFQGVRAANTITQKRQVYNELVNSGKFPDLPPLPGRPTEPEIEDALKKWEKAHPEALTPVRDDGQFFGFKEVGKARLERYTRFLFIPAVRDASQDASEGRGSVITELMDLVVRSTLAQREDVIRLREETQKKYEEIIDPSRLPELRDLAERMSEMLCTFAPDTQVRITWLPGQAVEIPMPKADVKVVEDGYPTAVERAGHGVQRAFILTALQHLAIAHVPVANVTDESKQTEPASVVEGTVPVGGESKLPLPNLILGIEEPELYQHPNRQRHLSQVLLRLASGELPGVADNIQIIYTTHSPLFVDLQRFHQIRLLRKGSAGDHPKKTRVFQATLDQVTRVIEKAELGTEGKYSADAVLARLYTLMTPWTNEGFFADVVVLVEGETDRAAILGAAQVMGYHLDTMDIAVIPCMGKKKLHKVAAVFRGLGIPTYLIWDCDLGRKNKDPEDNYRLFRFLGVPIRDCCTFVAQDYAYFEVDLTTTLRSELTPTLFDSLLAQCMELFEYDDSKQALKNPPVIKTIIEQAAIKGRKCLTLVKIVENIIALKKQASSQ